MKTSKTLILMVLCEAEPHVRALLDRLPRSIFDRKDLTILLIDDASEDATTQTITTWNERHRPGNLIAWRNPVQQKHGGNQKLGLRYAIDEGFDRVLVFPMSASADLIEVALEGIDESDFDVVLFPADGQSPSDRQVPLRAYSTKFLSRVPFELNTNEAHFDTEIILQAKHGGAKVRWKPVAIGQNRISWKVRFAVLRSVAQYHCHQHGFFCSLKYHRIDFADYADKRAFSGSTHASAIRELEKLRPKRVLDLGCAESHVAGACELLGAEVTGIDLASPKTRRPNFFQHDIESGPLPVDPSDFDVILLLDVIEHLSRPEAFLLSLRNQIDSAKPRTLVLSTPNVAFILIRLNLLFGRFNYAEKGILDITHRRLFTLDSLIKTLIDCGYTVDRVSPVGVPIEMFSRGPIGRALGRLASFAAHVWRRGFAFQFLIVCRPKPGIRHLLNATIPVVARTRVSAPLGQERAREYDVPGQRPAHAHWSDEAIRKGEDEDERWFDVPAERPGRGPNHDPCRVEK